MSEKVLGFYKKDGRKQYPSDGLIEQGIRSNTVVGYLIEKDNLVSVRLASESVDLKWLEKYVKHIRGCFEKNQPSDFEAGEETGRIEGLEVLLAEAKKEESKAGEKK